MSESSSSEKPEFCLPRRRGSRTFWVAATVQSQRGLPHQGWVVVLLVQTLLGRFCVCIGIHWVEAGASWPLLGPGSKLHCYIL